MKHKFKFKIGDPTSEPNKDWNRLLKLIQEDFTITGIIYNPKTIEPETEIILIREIK